MSDALNELHQRIDALHAHPAGESLPGDARDVVNHLLDALQAGEARAARRAADGTWEAIPWVKRGILVAFRLGTVVPVAGPCAPEAPREHGSFFDKDTLPLRHFVAADGVRVVPGGSSVRRGAYMAKGVVCMPPMYVNVGAWVGSGTMIDSHALVGSCAQIGERVHLSAAAQIGGVLEPINAAPVVVEDDVIVGGNCGVYEGTVVRQKAVLGAGVILTRGTPVYDLVNERVLRGSPERPLEIPEGAVVVGGSRAVSSDWGKGQGIALYTPVIVKYRDEKTDLATALEGWLR